MNSKELRIGNLVYQGEKYKESKVTSYELYNFDTRERGGSVAEYYKDWKPIPLTEEWLLKFGFKKDGSIFKLQESFFSIKKLDDKFYFLFSVENTFNSIRICDIHTLQNLIYSLTGQELTNH